MDCLTFDFLVLFSKHCVFSIVYFFRDFYFPCSRIRNLNPIVNKNKKNCAIKKMLSEKI